MGYEGFDCNTFSFSNDVFDGRRKVVVTMPQAKASAVEMNCEGVG